VNYFTLDVLRFIALRTSIASPARGAVAEPVILPIASRYCTLPSRIRSTVPVIRPLRSRGALRCAQRDLTRGAFGNLPSCFARRAASVSNDRAILSNFFLTRGSVAPPSFGTSPQYVDTPSLSASWPFRV